MSASAAATVGRDDAKKDKGGKKKPKGLSREVYGLVGDGSLAPIVGINRSQRFIGKAKLQHSLHRCPSAAN